jgi:hypothetical protein
VRVTKGMFEFIKGESRDMKRLAATKSKYANQTDRKKSIYP